MTYPRLERRLAAGEIAADFLVKIDRAVADALRRPIEIATSVLRRLLGCRAGVFRALLHRLARGRGLLLDIATDLLRSFLDRNAGIGGALLDRLGRRLDALLNGGANVLRTLRNGCAGVLRALGDRLADRRGFGAGIIGAACRCRCQQYDDCRA